MGSVRLSAGELATLCRTLRYQLAAGVRLVQVLRQQSERGSGSVRALSGRWLTIVEAGEPLSAALERDAAALPPLFVAMVQLAETTGHLPEVLGELERYYTLEQQLRRRLRTQMALPVLQFGFAILLITGLIYLLGLLAGAGRPLLTFWGLGGAAGALAFFATATGIPLALWLLWQALRRWTRLPAGVDRLLLRLPGIGPCLQALAMARLTLALQLSLDSSLALTKALRLSLRATGNAAYAGAADACVRVIKGGGLVSEALAATRLFPEDFLLIVASAEEVGSVPEAMRTQAAFYFDEAARRLSGLLKAAALGTWFLYAAFMVWLIFKIAGVYLGALGV